MMDIVRLAAYSAAVSILYAAIAVVALPVAQALTIAFVAALLIPALVDMVRRRRRPHG